VRARVSLGAGGRKKKRWRISSIISRSSRILFVTGVLSLSLSLSLSFFAFYLSSALDQSLGATYSTVKCQAVDTRGSHQRIELPCAVLAHATGSGVLAVLRIKLSRVSCLTCLAPPLPPSGKYFVFRWRSDYNRQAPRPARARAAAR